MTWDAIGAIGGIVGAAAVVVSLLYLAIQIKNQNRESRVAAIHDISVGFRDTVAEFGNPDTAALYVRGMESVGGGVRTIYSQINDSGS